MENSATQLEEAQFREVLGHFATGVTVVTIADDDGQAGFTCQAFASLSLKPPLVFVAPSQESRTWKRIESRGIFCVNILEQSQESLARLFSSKADAKFDGVGWQPGSFGLPHVNGALAWVECEVHSVHSGGDHLLAVGKVFNSQSSAGAPLLFFRGGYTNVEN